MVRSKSLYFFTRLLSFHHFEKRVFEQNIKEWYSPEFERERERCLLSHIKDFCDRLTAIGFAKKYF